jgi:hypothetical protein
MCGNGIFSMSIQSRLNRVPTDIRRRPMRAALICISERYGPISAAARVALSRTAETVFTQ